MRSEKTRGNKKKIDTKFEIKKKKQNHNHKTETKTQEIEIIRELGLEGLNSRTCPNLKIADEYVIDEKKTMRKSW